ncbi:hypothetical protein B0I37DRAFT_418043 [Chaetomium sp. MPI-CAGE-AT-0009]|nr:hypothetical protein B0I37DRAFT_418043 [Chaetomium sp. MPI-CAGE-AT-0009]
MAEFLAVTGGLAAVVQLAVSGRDLAKTLYRFAVDTGAAAAEVERFANQNPESPVVAFIKNSQVLENIYSEASTVRAHLRAIRDQVIDMKSRWVLWASIKWNFKKLSILELSPEMESVKTSLCLLMASTNLEALHLISRSRDNQDSNDELAKEMREDVVESLNGNIISIGTAQALSLEIETLEPDEGVTFDFGTGRPERSVGKMTFQWEVQLAKRCGAPFRLARL